MPRAGRQDSPADLYSVLGVERTATDAEIRAAYHALVARYHPDRHQGNPLEELAAAKMTEINRAYEVLSHLESRAAHDATTSAPGSPSMPGGTGRSVAPRRMMTGLVLLATLVAILPLLFRLGGGVLRALGGLVRGAVEAAEALRGTPLAAVLAVGAIALLAWAGLRRRRRRRSRIKATRAEDRAR